VPFDRLRAVSRVEPLGEDGAAVLLLKRQMKKVKG